NLLYKDLQKCRDILFEYLGKWDKSINPDLLDEGIQKLLDRLIFIRVAEDRGIEPPTLKPMIRQARSNSSSRKSLYQLMAEEFRKFDAFYNSNLFSEHPFEQWEEYTGVTEKVINILYGKEGYYEYDFKAMPADVLGTVYENYLSHRLLKSKKGTTTSKDANKRKDQGIYYTPNYIVNYIVKNALGPVLDKCKIFEDIKKIKILDPACGSGSFLIKAFEIIFEKYKELGFEGQEDLLKIQILKENIYGVDLDQQAVEITRLNLLINALTKREKLPFLNNIKNGNSLISGTEETLKEYFGDDFRNKKPFNWQEEFTNVFDQGGFDVIIGNPPYVNLANIKDVKERDFYKNTFKTAKNKSDLYSFFTEKAISLLKHEGILGFIFPNSWFGTDSFSKFREFLVKNTNIFKLVRLPSGIFTNAVVTTALIFLSKKESSSKHAVQLIEYRDGLFNEVPETLTYERIKKSPGFSFSFNKEISFNVPVVKLGKIGKLSLGIKTSDDQKFILNEKKDNDCYKLLRGKDVYRYFYKYAERWVWYKPNLMMQKIGAGPRKLDYFLTEKLLFRSITGGKIIATIDNENMLTNDKVHILYGIEKYSMKFILGIVNSAIINEWLKSTFNDLLEIKINQLEEIPIPKLNLFEKTDKEKHDAVVKLVDSILILNRKLLEAVENSNEWEHLKSEINKIDKKIDNEIYKLYYSNSTSNL
ncbi:MAG: N-6 DNA methylase, partial [Minisyncoccales bacterium]